MINKNIFVSHLQRIGYTYNPKTNAVKLRVGKGMADLSNHIIIKDDRVISRNVLTGDEEIMYDDPDIEIAIGVMKTRNKHWQHALIIRNTQNITLLSLCGKRFTGNI